MGLSILWSLIALGIILVAKQRRNRMIWVSGASLMGLVVLKLFLIDLVNHSSIERIISFIVVGLLLLVIGYIAPLPPKEAAREEA